MFPKAYVICRINCSVTYDPLIHGWTTYHKK